MDFKLVLMIALLMSLFTLIIFAFSGPSVEKARSRRLSSIRGRHGTSAEALMEARMRKAISNRPSAADMSMFVSLIPDPERLAKRIRMTGRKWTLSQYATACVGIFVVLAGLLMLRGWSPLSAIFVSLAAGLGLPHMVIGKMIARRVAKFTADFPDALELMVRGLRSGLPIGETLSVVSTEIRGPVGEEFKLVTERIRIGKSMDQALQETAERLGTPEMNFFVITLAIQRETGGNLAETLSNLANVLRQRSQMKLKIRAMSSESKASAYIVGSLPFIVFGLIYWINPNYLGTFFTDDRLIVTGLGGLVWMGIGVGIMAKMVSFEI